MFHRPVGAPSSTRPPCRRPAGNGLAAAPEHYNSVVIELAVSNPTGILAPSRHRISHYSVVTRPRLQSARLGRLGLPPRAARGRARRRAPPARAGMRLVTAALDPRGAGARLHGVQRDVRHLQPGRQPDRLRGRRQARRPRGERAHALHHSGPRRPRPAGAQKGQAAQLLGCHLRSGHAATTLQISDLAHPRECLALGSGLCYAAWSGPML